MGIRTYHDTLPSPRLPPFDGDTQAEDLPQLKLDSTAYRVGLVREILEVSNVPTAAYMRRNIEAMITKGIHRDCAPRAKEDAAPLKALWGRDCYAERDDPSEFISPCCTRSFNNDAKSMI